MYFDTINTQMNIFFAAICNQGLVFMVSALKPFFFFNSYERIYFSQCLYKILIIFLIGVNVDCMRLTTWKAAYLNLSLICLSFFVSFNAHHTYIGIAWQIYKIIFLWYRVIAIFILTFKCFFYHLLSIKSFKLFKKSSN